MRIPLPSSSPPGLSDLLDRDRIVARITALSLATDRKDRAAVEACFAPAVALDMSSVGAGWPAWTPSERCS
jgi:hypothetical protein